MTSLGKFGAATREYDPGGERDTFEFYGTTFTVHADIPGMLELTISAALAGKVSGVDGDAAMYEALRCALTVPEREVDGQRSPVDASQWERFYRLAIDRCAPGELLTAITLNIMGAQVGRPTGQRSTSPSGSLPTSTSSNSSASPSPESPPPSRDEPVFRPVDEVIG
jgi:hypothetical protein